MQSLLKKLNFLCDLHAVGGCVRDHFIGRDSDDIDLATSDHPKEVVRKCDRHDIRVITDVGIEHGTVLVLLGSQEVEVTTFRKDLLCDGRHAEVEFTDSLEEDLSRRDFTINAMAIDSEGDLKDPFEGKEDLEKEKIQTVGKPVDRFQEDLLRILRAARFSARYNFEIEKETKQAMEDLSDRVLENVSVERVVMEFNKAFKDPKPSRFLQMMFDLGLLQELIPEFEGMDELEQNPKHHPEGDVFSHILQVVDRAKPKPKDRWRALLHDIGKMPTAEKVESEDFCQFHGHASVGEKIVDRVSKDLKFSNDLRESLKVCTKNHMVPLHADNQEDPISDKQIRRFQNKVGDHLDDLQRLCEADHGRGDNPLFKEMEDPIEPMLMGRHLIERGHEPGPHFGDALDAAFQHQLDKGCTNKEELYKVAKSHLND